MSENTLPIVPPQAIRGLCFRDGVVGPATRCPALAEASAHRPQAFPNRSRPSDCDRHEDGELYVTITSGAPFQNLRGGRGTDLLA